MRRSSTAVGSLAAVLLAAPAGASAQEVIFDSLRPSHVAWRLVHDQGETSSRAELPVFDGERDAQAGGCITFAGTARHLTDARIRLRGHSGSGDPSTASVTLRLWESDGGLPGELLWSGVQSVTVPIGNHPTVDLDFYPDVPVPDTLIWTFALEDIQPTWGQSFGAGLQLEPALVGTSADGTIAQDSATLQWYEDTSTINDQPVHLEARFTAVPAPSAGALGLALALAAARRRR